MVGRRVTDGAARSLRPRSMMLLIPADVVKSNAAVRKYVAELNSELA